MTSSWAVRLCISLLPQTALTNLLEDDIDAQGLLLEQADIFWDTPVDP